MKKEPEFIQVNFGSLRPWDKNPRNITTENAKNLAEKIKKKGLFRNFVCWQEKDDVKKKTFTVGGGNMRFAAMKDVLKVPADRRVWISLNYPETEAEKIELSLLDNMPYGAYMEQPLAELIYPYRDELTGLALGVPLAKPVDLEKFLSQFTPPETEESVEKFFQLIVEFEDEETLRAAYERFEKEGLKCRISIL